MDEGVGGWEGAGRMEMGQGVRHRGEGKEGEW